MKKFVVCLLAVCFIIGAAFPAFAKNVCLSGQTEGGVKAVAVIVTGKNADLYNLTSPDIFWINQADVSEDGSFSLKMPFYSDSYEIHTNVPQYNINDIPKVTAYLSSGGSDSNSGLTPDKPKKTFAGIYSMADDVGEIVLLSDMTLSMPSSVYEGDLSITGSTGNEVLSAGGLNLKGDLKLDNLVFNGTGTGDVSCYIFANGFSLEMGEGLTSTGRLTVYGGKSGDTCASTDLKLLGGQYRGIYGGGYNGAVTGDTNVIVGGNVNPYDDIDDSNSSTLSPTYVYGGSYGAAVGGKTNITVGGNAVANCVVGAGNGAGGTVSDTNINITGGKIMNVYGGGLSGGPSLAGCNTHITMTGGKVESIFGGCGSKNMTGNTFVSLKGGEITRRVYSGCYNDYGFGWSSDCCVSGITAIDIGPGVSLCTGSGLSSSNRMNSGVFAGSRTANSHSAEKNYLIFSDGSYASKSSKTGEQVSSTSTFKSFANYTLNVSSGGRVASGDTAGVIDIVPDAGRGVLVNNARTFYKSVTVSDGLTTVVFDGITDASAQAEQGGVSGEVSVSTSSANKLIAAIYDEQEKKILGVQLADCAVGDNDIDIDIDCVFEQGKTYTVQFYLWEDMTSVKPLTTKYVIDLQ